MRQVPYIRFSALYNNKIIIVVEKKRTERTTIMVKINSSITEQCQTKTDTKKQTHAITMTTKGNKWQCHNIARKH